MDYIELNIETEQTPDIKMSNPTYEAFVASREKVLGSDPTESIYNEFVHSKLMLENKISGANQEYVDSYKEMVAAASHERSRVRSEKGRINVDGSFPNYPYTDVQVMMMEAGILR